jgi:hypothetical protein
MADMPIEQQIAAVKVAYSRNRAAQWPGDQELLDALLAAVKTLEAMQWQWRPINKDHPLPRDGTNYAFCCTVGSKATHWIPLPPIPGERDG